MPHHEIVDVIWFRRDHAYVTTDGDVKKVAIIVDNECLDWIICGLEYVFALPNSTPEVLLDGLKKFRREHFL